MIRLRPHGPAAGFVVRPRRSFASFPSSAGRVFVLLVALTAAAPATAPQERTSKSPPVPFLDHIDFSPGGRESVRLPVVLAEVSGLVATPDGRVFGHNDERAVVYEIDPGTGTILKAFSAGVLGVPGDFEGIAFAKGRFFLVTSSGLLVEVEEGPPGSSMSYRTHRTGLNRLCEVEGLAFDPVREEFLMPCKEARNGELEDHLVVFAVPLATLVPYQVPRVYVPFETLDDMGLGKAFNPSAIEVVPGTGDILVLAGKQEALVELNDWGGPLAVRELNKGAHPQPEGLAILPDFSLLIGDEGQAGPGTLTRYRPIESQGQGSP